MTTFTPKERLRFRKLLEVANSSTFTGERDAALGAATRLAESHGLTLREAAGMSDHEEVEEPARSRRDTGFRAGFGARRNEFAEAMSEWRKRPGFYHSEADRLAAEKRHHQEAMAEALRRGLDAEERAQEAKRAAQRQHMRPSSRGSWRSRPEFVRVLLRETSMSAREIAAAAGVTIYDVFREKLLMRRPRVAV